MPPKKQTPASEETQKEGPRRSTRTKTQTSKSETSNTKGSKDDTSNKRKSDTKDSTANKTQKMSTNAKKSSSSSDEGKGKEEKSKSASKSSSKPKQEHKSDPKSSSKSQQGEKKTHGSKHDTTTPPAKHNATPDHLPKVGQKVTWKAMPGWVHGEVLEILTQEKEVEGKKVKASKGDPRIVLKSHGPSGKIAVHKVGGVWFD